MRLALNPDQRGAIIGKTGTGKSYLARRLLPKKSALAIIDPKQQFDFPNCKIYDSADKILKEKPSRFIYRPKPENMSNIADYNKIYRYCYERGNILVYTDDMVGIMDRTKYPHYMGVCYMMGRAKKVAMLSAFQRPAWLPGFLMSESNKFYVFILNQPTDVKKVGDMVPGYDPSSFRREESEAGRLHTFYYYSDRETAVAKRFRLEEN